MRVELAVPAFALVLFAALYTFEQPDPLILPALMILAGIAFLVVFIWCRVTELTPGKATARLVLFQLFATFYFAVSLPTAAWRVN